MALLHGLISQNPKCPVQKNEEVVPRHKSPCFLEGAQRRPVRACASSARCYNKLVTNDLRRPSKMRQSTVRTFEGRYKSLRTLDLYRPLEDAHGGPNFECLRTFEKMAGFCTPSIRGVDSAKCGALTPPLARAKCRFLRAVAAHGVTVQDGSGQLENSQSSAWWRSRGGLHPKDRPTRTAIPAHYGSQRSCRSWHDVPRVAGCRECRRSAADRQDAARALLGRWLSPGPHVLGCCGSPNWRQSHQSCCLQRAAPSCRPCAVRCDPLPLRQWRCAGWPRRNCRIDRRFSTRSRPTARPVVRC